MTGNGQACQASNFRPPSGAPGKLMVIGVAPDPIEVMRYNSLPEAEIFKAGLREHQPIRRTP
jgi:hypothetical protein